MYIKTIKYISNSFIKSIYEATGIPNEIKEKVCYFSCIAAKVARSFFFMPRIFFIILIVAYSQISENQLFQFEAAKNEKTGCMDKVIPVYNHCTSDFVFGRSLFTQ